MNKFAYFKMMFPAEMRKMAAEEAEQEEQNTSKKEQKAKNKEKAKAENQASKSERRRSGKYHSELLGGTTSALTSGLLGALIGGGIGRGIEASPVRAVTNELGQAQIDPNGYPIMEPSLTPNGNQMWTGAAKAATNESESTCYTGRCKCTKTATLSEPCVSKKSYYAK